LTSFRVIDKLWWMTTTTKNLTWMTTIVRIVFDVVVYQLIVVVSRILLAVNVLNKRLLAFRYVLNSSVDVFLFNFRRFRFVFESSFINCLTFVSFYASTIYRWRHLWKSDRFCNLTWLFEIVNEMIEKIRMRLTKKRYELMRKNCLLWKYRELVSHSCSARNSKDSWSQSEFWKIIKFCVIVIDFMSMQW
jgi:hypothetical protein